MDIWIDAYSQSVIAKIRQEGVMVYRCGSDSRQNLNIEPVRLTNGLDIEYRWREDGEKKG